MQKDSVRVRSQSVRGQVIYEPWWRHDMASRSAFLAICEECRWSLVDPPTKAGYVEFWYECLYKLYKNSSISHNFRSSLRRQISSIGHLIRRPPPPSTHTHTPLLIKTADILQMSFFQKDFKEMIISRFSFHWSLLLQIELTIITVMIQLVVERRRGYKPLPMLPKSLVNICVPRLQCVW